MRPTPIPPQPGQESVWDYPRPAILEATDKPIKVVFNGVVIADTQAAKRVLETSHPPTYYIPASDIQLQYLVDNSRRTFCEWKGVCSYYDVVVEDKLAIAGAWRYPSPSRAFVGIEDCYCFSARLMDACYVNGEQVTPQPGEYYAGWITSDIVGPFKGGPGTMGW